MPRPELVTITSAERWSILIAPLRLEIAEGLRCIGPCSVAELAALLDRPADTLYRHLDLLEQAGFVVECGYRKRGRHVEQLVDLAAEDFQIAFTDPTGAAECKAIVETSRHFMRAAERAIRDSADARQFEFGRETGNLSLSYELGWLTPEAFREVRSLVRRIKSIVDAGKRQREGRLYLSLAIVTPVTRRSRRTRRGAATRPCRSRRQESAGAGVSAPLESPAPNASATPAPQRGQRRRSAPPK